MSLHGDDLDQRRKPASDDDEDEDGEVVIKKEDFFKTPSGRQFRNDMETLQSEIARLKQVNLKRNKEIDEAYLKVEEMTNSKRRMECDHQERLDELSRKTRELERSAVGRGDVAYQIRRSFDGRSPLTETPKFDGRALFGYMGSDEEKDKKDKPFVKWTFNFDRNKATLRSFIGYFNTFAELGGYDDQQKCHQLLRSFGMDAMRIVERLGRRYNYEKLVAAIYDYFEPEESKQSKQIKLNSLQRKKSESARDFANRVQDLVGSCFTSLSKGEQDEMTVARFIQGHDKESMRDLLSCRFKHIDHAVNHMDMLEASGITSYATDATSTRAASSKQASKATAATAAIENASANVADINSDNHEAEVDAIVDACAATMEDDGIECEDDVLVELAARVYKKFPEARRTGKCYYCGAPGHLWMKCYKLRMRLQKQGYRPPSSRFGGRTRSDSRGRGRRFTPRPDDRRPGDRRPDDRRPNPKPFRARPDSDQKSPTKGQGKMKYFMESMLHLFQGMDSDEFQSEDDKDEKEEEVDDSLNE